MLWHSPLPLQEGSTNPGTFLHPHIADAGPASTCPDWEAGCHRPSLCRVLKASLGASELAVEQCSKPVTCKLRVQNLQSAHPVPVRHSLHGQLPGAQCCPAALHLREISLRSPILKLRSQPSSSHLLAEELSVFTALSTRQ